MWMNPATTPQWFKGLPGDARWVTSGLAMDESLLHAIVYFTRDEPRFCKNWPWTSFSSKHFTCHRQSVANPRVHRVVAQYVIISKSKCGYLKNKLRELASKRSWRPGRAFCFDGNPVETFWGLELQLRAVDGCLGPKVGLGLGREFACTSYMT